MKNQSNLVGEVGLVYKTDTSVADLPTITDPEQGVPLFTLLKLLGWLRKLLWRMFGDL